MIGQKETMQRLLQASSSAILLLGPVGSGKSFVVQEYAKERSLPLYIDLSVEEAIDKLQSPVLNCVVSLSLEDLTTSDQNALLKAVEEPSLGTKFILRAVSTNNLLPTLASRLQSLEMCLYTREDLASLIKEVPAQKRELLLEVAQTPGQVQEWLGVDVQSLYSRLEYIFQNIQRASLANALSLSYEFYSETGIERWPLLLVGRMCRVMGERLYKEGSYYFWPAIISFEEQLQHKSLNKRMLIDRFLISLWRISHES